jgi:hypothetical protein
MLRKFILQHSAEEVARAYDAQCTPDFFGFNARDELQYRGRLDAARMTPKSDARRDLFEAMKEVAETGHGPKEQIPSMGRSIKVALRLKVPGRTAASGPFSTHGTFLRHHVAATHERLHADGVRFGRYEMLPTFLLLAVFAMPVALADLAIVGARAERRLMY